jgi:hypothetical protein
MSLLRTLALPLVAGTMALSACSSGGSSPPAAGEAAVESVVAPVWDEDGEITIALTGRSATASSTGVDIAGSTLTITQPGTYRLSGSLDDGRVVVSSPGDGLVRLVLDGVDIHSSSTSPLATMDAGEVMVVLADGTTNVLTDSARYTFADPATDEPNATLFSTADLTISGTGSLTVKGAFNDGIASKDDLVVAGGTIAVDAVDDGIRGKDSVVVDGGTLTVNAGGDGLKSDNADDPSKGTVTVNAGSLDITSAGDGISAATNLVVADGLLDVTAGGGSAKAVATGASAKGLKGTAMVTIGSGTISIDSADDAIHSDTGVVVDGGTITIATGDDGIHADATLRVNAGSITVTKSYEGLESTALTFAGGDVRVVSTDDGINAARGDAFAAGAPTLTITGGRIVVDSGGDGLDVNGSATLSAGTVVLHGPTARMNGAVDYDGTFAISGGLLVAAGSSGMVMAPSTSSTQSSLLKTFSAQPAGTLVHVESSTGGDIVTFAPTKAFQSIVVSSPTIAKGETYNVSLGGSAGGASADGLYEAGAYRPDAAPATTAIGR